MTLPHGAELVDRAWELLCNRLDPGTRSVAARFSASLVRRAPAGTLSGFVQMAPLQELPLFAAEGAPGVRLDQLDFFRLAHVLGGFHGLVADRLADGQVERSPEILAIRGHLRSLWLEGLAAATGDGSGSRAHAIQSIARLRRAVARERTMLQRGAMSLDEYQELVHDKVAWLGVAARELLRLGAGPEARAAFDAAFDLLLLSAQCFDDALDAEEDAARAGHSVPACLGFPPGVLIRAGVRLVGHAGRAAEAGGFHALAEWAAERQRETDACGAPGDPAQNEFGALIVADNLLQRTLQAVGWPAPSPATPACGRNPTPPWARGL